jgi:predicted amidophosphoribosyltransferase
MTVCSSCGAELTGEESTCPACGAAIAETADCPRCGYEVSGADACPACGRAVESFRCAVHPDRDATGRCALCRRAVCAGCADEEKRLTLCDEHRETPIIEGWAQVYSTTSELEAQLLCDNLHAEELDAQVFSQKDMMFTLQLGELSIVRILVPVWQYEQALQMIRSHMDTSGEVSFACSVCGETYDTGVRRCASCGAALP